MKSFKDLWPLYVLLALLATIYLAGLAVGLSAILDWKS